MGKRIEVTWLTDEQRSSLANYRKALKEKREPTAEERAANAAYMRGWNAANPEKVKAANRKKALTGKLKEAYRRRVSTPEGRKKMNEDSIAYYHANWEKKQDQKWARKYGVTWQEINEMRQRPCEICGKHVPRSKQPGSKGGMVIDHCHKTNKIRGPLCPPCNSAIGFLRDDPSLMEAAAAYVRRHASFTRDERRCGAYTDRAAAAPEQRQ